MTSTPFPLRFIVQLLIGVLIVGGMLGYTLWQARHLLAGPQLTIVEAPPTMHDERTTVIAGVATNIVALSLNGREIYTDEAGHFEETIMLENGYTIVT